MNNPIPNYCGSCTMCCRLLAVDELKKPQDEWCTHCAIGKGCNTYETRPDSCASYQCSWRQSQNGPDPWSEAYRPDVLGVIFDGGGHEDGVLCARVHPTQKDRLQRPGVQRVIEAAKKAGAKVFVIIGDKRGLLSLQAESGRTGGVKVNR